MTKEQCRHLKIERYPPDSDDYQCERCLETFVVRLAAEPPREHRLEQLLKAVQTDAGNWLHSDLQKAITAAVGEAGEYRGLNDSGLSENREVAP